MAFPRFIKQSVALGNPLEHSSIVNMKEASS